MLLNFTLQTSNKAIQACTKACQRIVEEAITGFMSGLTFLGHLKEAGATTEEARDHINQYTQCRRDQEAAGAGNEQQPPASDQPNSDDPDPLNTATSLAWALLHARVNHLQPSSPQATSTPDSSLPDELASLFRLSSTKGAISTSVLTKAPHLSKLSDPTATNPHLEKTQDLLSVYSPQSSQDILVNKAQFALVGDPLPCTIWCKILLDLFINYKKLFTSMDKGYNHHNEPKDFGAGYALVKKDQAFSKHPIWTEAIGLGHLVHGLWV